MRNLKRVLSLALALVMVLGMMVITTSAADYTDADEITYTEAVDVMSALGVFQGDNGALKPTEILTREMAATILARIHSNGKVEKLVATKQIFDDVATTDWSAKYIEYCYNTGLIDGLGNGKFDPDGQMTGVGFAKLLLCAMGHDADAQGYVGKDWSVNISVDALNKGLMVNNVLLTDALTRELAAQMLFQALDAEMVVYEKYFDKATAAPVLVGPYPTGETFASKFFGGLAKVEGIICGFDMDYGDTIFYVGDDEDGEPIHWEVSYTGADFDKIGYAAYVWALPGGAEDVSYWNAISDLTVTGTSLGENTQGLGTYLLTNKYVNYVKNPFFVAQIDSAGCSVFYNGDYVGEYWDLTTADKYDVNDDVEDVLAKADKIGAKVDFVDNDNKGKAEAIVITEYTFDVVKDVQKVSASGNVYTLYYELANKKTSKGYEWKIYADDLYNVDSLSKGDFITFVQYGGYYLVNVLEAAEGEFESITRSKLSEETVKVYTIDGEDYIISEMDYVDAANFLKTNKINDDIVYVVDEYGYIVYAADPKADPDSYVFVIDNEDSHGIKDLAETEIAFVDGTVDIVDVDCDEDKEDGDLADKIYTYTVKNGAYVLEDAKASVKTGIDYTKKSLKMDGVQLTLGTTLVDLRDYLAGDADEGTVYTGYKQIPSFNDGTVYYLTAGGKMTLAFLVDGEDPTTAANLEASFVVFNTETNVVDEDKYGNLTYELEAGVLVEGEVVYDYVLTQTQKDAIDALGVGVYEFAKDGSLADYTTFEDDKIFWTPESSGALVKNDKDVTDDYTAIFLNIEEGEINDWYRYVEEGEYFCWIDKDNDIVYIVSDGVATDDKEVHVYYAKNAKVVTIYEGVAYYSAPGHVTNKTTQKLADAQEKAAANNLTMYVYEDGEFYESEGDDTIVTDSTETLKTVVEAAADGSTIYLKAGTYDVTTQINIDGKSIRIIGLGDVTIDLYTTRTNYEKVFYIYGSKVEDNEGITVELINMDIVCSGVASKGDIWVRTWSGSCRGDIDLVLDGVTCTSIMVDNNYSDGTVVNIDVKGSSIDWIKPDVSPFNGNGIDTYTNVTYDEASEITSIYVQSGVDEPDHITINGDEVTTKGEQL